MQARWIRALCVVGGAAALGLVLSPARAQNESMVCFYEGPRYTGQSFCARAGIDTADAEVVLLDGRPQNWSKRICSVQLVGDAKVTLWEGKNFSGPSLMVTRSEPDMRSVRTKSHGVRNWCQAPASYKTHF
jgi:hypothetical protein